MESLLVAGRRSSGLRLDRHDCRRETAVIVTADHGHFLVLDDAAALIPPERGER